MGQMTFYLPRLILLIVVMFFIYRITLQTDISWSHETSAQLINEAFALLKLGGKQAIAEGINVVMVLGVLFIYLSSQLLNEVFAGFTSLMSTVFSVRRSAHSGSSPTSIPLLQLLGLTSLFGLGSLYVVLSLIP